MQNAVETIRHLADQMNWVNQMFGPDAMGQMRDGMKAMKESGERQRGPKPSLPGAHGASPPLEIYVTSQLVVLCTILPGLSSPQHVWISLVGPKEILLEAFLESRAPDGVPLQQERFTGYCQRIVTLPAAILPEGATASYSDGILECRFPRLEQDGESTGVAFLHVNQS